MKNAFALTRRAVAVALLAAPFLAHAADFPSKPIRFIVPYTPGGTTDLVARTVGQKVSEKLGQPVLIDNRGGAGGNIGMDAVAKAAPDGYTIGFGAISTNALNPHIYKSMAFDPRKDFTAISLLGTSTIVLEVPAASPIKSVPDLIAAAKKNPGLPYATAGAGTSMNLAGVMFAQMTGTELVHVAYKGSGPAITDMLGNNIGVMFDNLPASLPHIQAGKLRALAVAGPHALALAARRADDGRGGAEGLRARPVVRRVRPGEAAGAHREGAERSLRRSARHARREGQAAAGRLLAARLDRAGAATLTRDRIQAPRRCGQEGRHDRRLNRFHERHP
jgi:tripartite-type tricarboxylate transporter receptor subunit TctC